ncbi:uncharacterized protein [Rutidosis leptorrhynchoides]|uniref:uncharacterized protein n=1 Tax=Rutidosis leptorrhynchoides TaxID=125765 RepID=UPI003A98D988
MAEFSSKLDEEIKRLFDVMLTELEGCDDDVNLEKLLFNLPPATISSLSRPSTDVETKLIKILKVAIKTIASYKANKDDDVKKTIASYKEKKDETAEIFFNLHDFLEDRKKKIEEELFKLRKHG